MRFELNVLVTSLRLGFHPNFIRDLNDIAVHRVCGRENARDRQNYIDVLVLKS